MRCKKGESLSVRGAGSRRCFMGVVFGSARRVQAAAGGRWKVFNERRGEADLTPQYPPSPMT